MWALKTQKKVARYTHHLFHLIIQLMSAKHSVRATKIKTFTVPFCLFFWRLHLLLPPLLFSLGLHMWHMEVTRLGVELELQLPAYITDTQCWIRASSAAYTAACGNAGSLTHWARPGMEHTSSRTLCWFLSFFFLIRATLMAYGSSQARDQIRAAATGLHLSHSHTRWEPHLESTLQFVAMPYP